jgi:hypothetical protein
VEAIGLTAETPVVSTVHHPYGSPSGPGLFRVKGLQLPAYIQNVAHALQRSGSAKTESQAIGMAVGIVKRWATGTGAKGKRVHPDVQAAAARAVAEWEAAKARAHSHANEGGAVIALTWNGQSIDLGYMPPHVPAGSSAGGQFGTTSGKGTNSGGTAGKTPAQQHKLHLAHIAHLQHLVATGKATPAQRQELAGLLKALAARPRGTPKPGTAAATEAAAAAAIAAHPAPGRALEEDGGEAEGPGQAAPQGRAEAEGTRQGRQARHHPPGGGQEARHRHRDDRRQAGHDDAAAVACPAHGSPRAPEGDGARE